MRSGTPGAGRSRSSASAESDPFTFGGDDVALGVYQFRRIEADLVPGRPQVRGLNRAEPGTGTLGRQYRVERTRREGEQSGVARPPSVRG